MGSRLIRLIEEEQNKRDAIIVRLYNEGYPVQQIASHLGKSRSVVYNRLKYLRVKREVGEQ